MFVSRMYRLFSDLSDRFVFPRNYFRLFPGLSDRSGFPRNYLISGCGISGTESMSPAMEPAALSILTWRLPLTLNSYVTTVSSLPPSPYIPKDSAQCCGLLQNFL